MTIKVSCEGQGQCVCRPDWSVAKELLGRAGSLNKQKVVEGELIRCTLCSRRSIRQWLKRIRAIQKEPYVFFLWVLCPCCSGNEVKGGHGKLATRLKDLLQSLLFQNQTKQTNNDNKRDEINKAQFQFQSFTTGPTKPAWFATTFLKFEQRSHNLKTLFHQEE